MVTALTCILQGMYAIMMLLAGAVMIAMAGAGIAEMGVAVYIMYANLGASLQGTSAHSVGDSAIRSALSGIEAIFLAPVGLLAIHGISIYIWQRIQSGTQGGAEGADDQPIVELKAWTLSLMVAVVATDLVGQLVGGLAIDRERVIAEGAAIVVLAVVLRLAFDRRAARHRVDSH